MLHALLPLLATVAAPLSAAAATAPTAAVAAIAVVAFDPPAAKKGKGGSSGTPAPADAGSALSRKWSICGGPSIGSLLCADIEVVVDGKLTTVRVRNFSGAPEINAGGAASAGQWVLTTVGFDGIAEAAGAFATGVGSTTGSWLQPTASATRPATWVAYNDKQFGGGVNVDLAIDNGNGVGDGIASSCAPAGTLPGGSNKLWITAVAGCGGYSIADAAANAGWFETTVATVDVWNPNAAGVSAFFKGQNGPGGASYECNVGGASPKGDCVDAQTYYADDVPVGAVVPEPRTVVLMATGLLGLLVPVVRRRRRAREQGHD